MNTQIEPVATSAVKSLPLGVLRVHDKAVIPMFHSAGAACFDLHACIDESRIVIRPGEAKIFRTGLKFEIPANWVMMIYSRSGHGFKHGIRLVNGVGVIDSDYTGEVGVSLYNDGMEAFVVFSGDRIAQAMLAPARPVEIIEVDEIKVTERGAGGFGSTGS